MPTFFNNCSARPHATLYGPEAFFDLRCEGAQADMATDLQQGQKCVVATPAQNGEVEFGWFAFSHAQVLDMPDEPGTKIRVLFGKKLQSERLPKAEASATEPYAVFFDVKGRFKRKAVLGRGVLAARR